MGQRASLPPLPRVREKEKQQLRPHTSSRGREQLGRRLRGAQSRPPRKRCVWVSPPFLPSVSTDNRIYLNEFSPPCERSIPLLLARSTFFKESKADEKAYKRSLKTMERFAARQKKDGEEFAREENHRRVNQPVRKRTSEQKKVDDEAERLWERLLDVPIRFLDAPIQTGGGDAMAERTAGAVTEDAPIQTGSGGDVAELAASAVTEAICNAGAELAPTFTSEPARADAETVTSDARDGGVSSGARGREHQQDKAAQRQRKYMLNWTPTFRVVSGLPPNNPDFDRLFIEAREKGLILRGVGAIGVARSGGPGRQRR